MSPVDPNATFRDLLAALAAGDAEAAEVAANDLAAWIARGGFTPPALTTALEA